MKISFSNAAPKAQTDLYVIAVAQGAQGKIKGRYAKFARAILSANPDFKGEAGSIAVGVVPGFKFKRLALLGLGSDMSQLALETAGGKLVAAIKIAKTVFVDTSEVKGFTASGIAALASGAHLRAYEFRLYRTKEKKSSIPVSVTFGGGTDAQRAYQPLAQAAEAVHWARDLVNEPSNVLYPESFAKRVVDKLKPFGVKVTVLNDKALEEKGFGAMMAVGKAAENKPRLVLMEYKGEGAPTGKPVALVGKGITFDSGGYSIKPSDGMIEMKCDMAGAAAVAGAMMTLASGKAPVHVVAALAMAENMISDEGYKPSDVLTSLSGQTIEVTNTDAEGRLVLCDTLWYVQETYKPRACVNIATLTGAALVALGEEYAAIFANDDALWSALEQSSKATGDKAWRLPLDPAFVRAMDSNIADMKNASSTRYGGSCTGAGFLSRFIQKGVKWAHVDMAPTMVTHTDQALCPKGATGYGVRLLAEWAKTA